AGPEVVDEVPLRAVVGGHGAVPIQVVLAEVQDDGDLGRERRAALELEGRELDDVRGPWPGDGGERGVVVAAGDGVHAGSPKHGLEPGRGRALAGGAGDADVAAGHAAPGPLDLADQIGR